MSAREAMIGVRAEICLREIAFTAYADRRTLEGGAFANRAQVLANLRRIKLRAIEAEVLLRSLDRVDVNQFAGSSSSRAPGASPPGGAVSTPSPAPSSCEVSHG